VTIRAIISDVGDVLSRFNVAKRNKSIAETLGIGLHEFTDWWEVAPDGREPMWRSWCRGEFSSDELITRCAERFGRRLSCEEFESMWLSGFDGAITGTIELIQAARFHRDLRVVSCTDVDPFYGMLLRKQGEELHDFFDAEVQSWQVGVLKPHPRMYEEAVRQTGFSAGECLFLDDLAMNVEGARRVGLRAIQFTTPEQLAADFARRELLP